jgi:hypothetical protein
MYGERPWLLQLEKRRESILEVRLVKGSILQSGASSAREVVVGGVDFVD